MADSVTTGLHSRQEATADRVAINKDTALFLIAMLGVTIAPLVFVPLFAESRGSSKTVDNIFSLLLVLSTMHVALTLFFYTDRRYRVYFKANSRFYYILPIFVIVGAGLSYEILGRDNAIYVFLFYHAWLLYHYGRQNYGLLCFASIGTGSARVSKGERIILHLAPVAGILAAMPLLGPAKKSIFAPHLELFYGAGLAIFICLIGVLAYVLVNHFRNRTSLWHSSFLLTLGFFYIPTFLSGNYLAGVMSYAIAHALQYFVFMYYLAADQKQGSAHARLFTLVGVAVAGWVTIWIFRDANLWGTADQFAAGIGLGIVMAHFVVDSGTWKLSRSFQRSAVKDSFHFLFK